MNRLEFDEVLKVSGINNPLFTTIGVFGTDEEVHFWNNLVIWFSGGNFAVVGGKIPFEVANIIYEKYPNNRYDFSEKYEKDVEEYISRYDPTEFVSKNELAKELFRNRKEEDKYLTKYYIETKESFLIFLTEFKDYLLRKQGMKETEVKKYDELITMLNSEILKKVNPSISAYEWMQKDDENRETYNVSIERDKKTKIGQMFRKAIQDFDNAVNPFQNNDIELDEISNYIKNVKISADLSDCDKDEKFIEDCCGLEISDLKNVCCSCTYFRKSDGFSYELSYDDDNNYFKVLHYYNATKNKLNAGEIISIYSSTNDFELDINFNITNGKAWAINTEKKPATLEQIAIVYDELLKATEYASSITIENMKKKDNVRQLLPNN